MPYQRTLYRLCLKTNWAAYIDNINRSIDVVIKRVGIVRNNYLTRVFNCLLKLQQTIYVHRTRVAKKPA